VARFRFAFDLSSKCLYNHGNLDSDFFGAVMNNSQYILGPICITVLLVIAGCNELGVQLANVLPENGGPSLGTGQLNESGDTEAIDLSQIGGGNSSMVMPGADGAGDMNGFSDPVMNGEYAGMMENVDEGIEMEGDFGDGAITGVGDEQEMMQLADPSDESDEAVDNADLNSQKDSLEPAIIGDEEGTAGYMAALGAAGGLPDPQMGNYAGGMQQPQNPTNGRGSQKQVPSRGFGNGGGKGSSSKNAIPNIRDQGNKPNGGKSSGTTDSRQKPSMEPNSRKPGAGNTNFKTNTPAVRFQISGNVTNPVYKLINTVAVPILLENGTGMSFSTEVLQQRELTSRGNVYWVVHSQRLGFSPIPVPSGGGQLNVAIAKFTPTSGPFKAFIAAVESDGQVKYLSSPVDIKWNP
jgi:hypothetical protein